jgi:hypothetical protein
MKVTWARRYARARGGVKRQTGVFAKTVSHRHWIPDYALLAVRGYSGVTTAMSVRWESRGPMWAWRKGARLHDGGLVIVSAPIAPVFRPPAGARVTFLEWPRKVTQRGHPDRVPAARGGRRGRGLRTNIPVRSQTVGIHASPATRPDRPRRPHCSTGPRDPEPADRRVSMAARLKGLAPRDSRTGFAPTRSRQPAPVGANPVRESFEAGNT